MSMLKSFLESIKIIETDDDYYKYIIRIDELRICSNRTALESHQLKILELMVNQYRANSYYKSDINPKSRSVVQDWVKENMTLRQQATLLSALRGCDGVSKHDPAKKLTRALRKVMLNPADPDFMNDPNNTFMKGSISIEIINEFLGDIDHYPTHWLIHFTHAAMLVGFFHPDNEVGIIWLSLYHAIVTNLHMHPETKDEVNIRLRDGRRTVDEEIGARARI